jgi:hypothetical protein
VASVRQCDGALRHDTMTSDAGHVPASGERNAAVGGSKPERYFMIRSYAAALRFFFFCFSPVLLFGGVYIYFHNIDISILLVKGTGLMKKQDYSSQFSTK